MEYIIQKFKEGANTVERCRGTTNDKDGYLIEEKKEDLIQWDFLKLRL